MIKIIKEEKESDTIAKEFSKLTDEMYSVWDELDDLSVKFVDLANKVNPPHDNSYLDSKDSISDALIGIKKLINKFEGEYDYYLNIISDELIEKGSYLD